MRALTTAAKPFPIPAPVKGWNTVDSLAEIPLDMATTLDNWVPSTSSVSSRKGRSTWSTGVGSGNVDSLFELKGAAVSKMISASGGGIYDSTLQGVGTLLKSGFTSNIWKGTVFNAQLGLVNGADAPQVYDGTTVSNMTVSGVSNTALLNMITTFKNRTYFGYAGSQSFYYSALNTLGGALTEFPLGRIGTFGGNLVGIETITKDGGSGQDDAICFFMSTGEIIVYEGTDPGTNFVLTGKFLAGRPLNSRAIYKFGADILFATNEGYLPVSALLPLSYGKDNVGINKYIKGAASAAASSFGSYDGWQIILSPNDNILLVNVPQSNNTFVQHVLNVNTMAWSRFTGLNARCWAVFGDDLYFGSTNGTVYKYGSDYLDVDTTVPLIYGSPNIRFSRATTRTSGFRPIMRFGSDMTMTVKTSVDYKPFSLPYTVSYTVSGADWGDEWGTMWSRPNSIINYLNFNNICHSAALSLTVACGGNVDFFGIDFLPQAGTRL